MLEDERLVESLEERHEGSYKTGCFQGGEPIALERVLEVKLHGHDEKVCSHIDSCLRTFEETYYAIKQLLD